MHARLVLDASDVAPGLTDDVLVVFLVNDQLRVRHVLLEVGDNGVQRAFSAVNIGRRPLQLNLILACKKLNFM